MKLYTNNAGTRYALDGIKKRDGIKAGLPARGWEWIRGVGAPGLWRLKGDSAGDVITEAVRVRDALGIKFEHCETI